MRGDTDEKIGRKMETEKDRWPRERKTETEKENMNRNGRKEIKTEKR